MYQGKQGWNNVEELSSRVYTCYNCGHNISSNEGYRYFVDTGLEFSNLECISNIYICHNCNSPTYFDGDGNQYPGAKYGNEVQYLPEEVKTVYDEARNCFSVNAFTSSVLCCRKLLMNISCTVGASEGLRFVQYVDYLDNKGYIPPNGKKWVSKIKKLGNDGTHKIENRSEEDAILAIQFTSMLLKFIYEFPKLLEK